MGYVSRAVCLYAVPMLAVNAASIARDLQTQGVDRSHLVILRNSLDDPDVFEPPTRKAVLADLGMSDKDRFVIIVGNLRPVKNHPLFLEAMTAVASRFPDVRGVIVGQTAPSEPQWASFLRARSEELGLGRVVIFAGFRTDVSRLLSHATVACLTSNEEGTPNAIVEAMAAGVPVVATNVGGVAELVDDGVTGFLVEAGSTDALAEALCRVLADEGLANRLGAGGQRAALRRHDPARAASRLAALYLGGLR